MLGYEEIDELLHALMDAFEGGPALTVGEEEVQPYELIAKLHELIDAAQEDVVKVGRVLSAKNEGLIRQVHDALPELADVLAQVLAAVEVEAEAEKRGPIISYDAEAGRYSVFAPIVKVTALRKTVTSHVLAANVVDYQDDYIRPDEIWKALEGYMIEFQDVGVMHRQLNPELFVVECYQAPADFTVGGQPVKEGDWLMTVKVLDSEVWERIEKGELRGFSIGGRANRVKMEEAPADVGFVGPPEELDAA